jgi:hypothetical protein
MGLCLTLPAHEFGAELMLQRIRVAPSHWSFPSAFCGWQSSQKREFASQNEKLQTNSSNFFPNRPSRCFVRLVALLDRFMDQRRHPRIWPERAAIGRARKIEKRSESSCYGLWVANY